MPSSDGIALGSVLNLGLKLTLGITLGKYKSVGADDGISLGVALIKLYLLGMLARE